MWPKDPHQSHVSIDYLVWLRPQMNKDTYRAGRSHGLEMTSGAGGQSQTSLWARLIFPGTKSQLQVRALLVPLNTFTCDDYDSV